MKKFIKITLSLVLAVILLATAMPIYAVEDDSIKEVEELREENVKHFEMPDGTFKAIVYSEPVHRKDADGKWQDIDNTLSSEKENGNTNYSSFDGRIKFSKNIKNANGKILELSENGYKISFSLIDENIKSTSADVKNHKGKKTPTIFDSEREKLDKLQSVDNLTKVRYNDIRKDIDLEYEIYANNIKESIIVNSKQSEYVYKFELKLNKLLAILNEDGSISLIDEESGEEKYTMPAPFMFDDNGELSTDVYYTLTQNGKYKYELTVTADKEWINDSDRKFPVTIDPTLDATNCYYEEAYVSSSNPYSNYSKPSDGRLFVGSTKRIFLKFELPTISGNFSITSAYLIMHFYFYASMYGSMSIGAYSVPYSWNENSITWNNSVASHQSADNSATILSTNDVSSNMSATEYLPMFLPFDVTEAVRDWYTGEDNNGIAIKRMSGMTNDIAFEGYNSALYNIPVLEIDYQVRRETVYIGNLQTNGYIQNEGDSIFTSYFDGNANQKWYITYLESGYYKITSDVNGKALTVSSDSDGSVVLETYNASHSQMWNITQDQNGCYNITPRSNSSYFLSSIGNNVKVRSSSSNSDDYKWVICVVADYVLAYLGESTNDYRMVTLQEEVIEALKTNAYMVGRGECQMNKTTMLSLLSNTSVFSSLTHGTRTSILDSYGNELRIDDINGLDDLAFNNLQFVYLAACSTGMGETTGNNLVNAIHNKGADAVLGFVHEVEQGETIYWTKHFMLNLSVGMTIHDAMAAADFSLENSEEYGDNSNYTTASNYRYFRGSDQIIPCS